MDPLEQIRQAVERNKLQRQQQVNDITAKTQRAHQAFEPIVAVLTAINALSLRFDPGIFSSRHRNNADWISWSIDYCANDTFALRLPFEAFDTIHFHSEYGWVTAMWRGPMGREEVLQNTDAILDALISLLLDYSNLDERLTALPANSPNELSPELSEALSGLAPVISRVIR